jgi:mitogen-activated protein kinase 1/3
VEQCLEHPYLDAYHDPDDEPTAKPLDSSFFEFDLMKDNLSREELRRLLYDEIISFHKQ